LSSRSFDLVVTGMFALKMEINICIYVFIQRAY
jgi:hypothetical protein